MEQNQASEYGLHYLVTYSRWRDPTFDTYFPQLSQSISDDARAGIIRERKMTIARGCRLYPKAIAWCILLSCSIIMEAYGKSLVGSLLASPGFRLRFGASATSNDAKDQDQYQVSATWQTGLVNAAVGAEILGLLLNGALADRYGYNVVMIGSLAWLCLAIPCSVFAVGLPMLLVSQALCGLAWGIFQVLSATYAAEVLPIALRPFLLGNINMCWLIGQLAGNGIVHACLGLGKEWSYRLPFSLQWAWAIPILGGVCFVPDGPWWLVRHERVDDARKALQSLTQENGGHGNIDEMIHLMQHTNDLEKRMICQGTSYRDCFRSTNRRRTEISCMVWMSQAFCGSGLIGYVSYFYQQAGFDTYSSFKLATVVSGLAILGGMVSWVLLPRVGRRRLYLAGLVGLLSILLAGGSVSITLATSQTRSWIVGSMLMGIAFVYNVTVGPVCFILMAEIPSTRLRVKTIILARVMYNVAIIVNNVLVPLMLNPTAWDWKGRSMFYYTITAAVCLLWCYYRLPETQGLAYLELDILFTKGVAAREFRLFRAKLQNSGYLGLNEIERSSRIWHGWRGYS